MKRFFLLEKMVKIRLEMPEGRSCGIYNNMFQRGNRGRHIASVRSTFEKIYGANAWTPFNNAVQQAFENSYDEIWTQMPAMSALPVED